MGKNAGQDCCAKSSYRRSVSGIAGNRRIMVPQPRTVNVMELGVGIVQIVETID